MKLHELISTHIKKRREWVELRQAKEPDNDKIEALDREPSMARSANCKASSDMTRTALQKSNNKRYCV